MKSVVCYGDSNTFGSNPHGGRWGEDVRWTRRLQRILGSEYYIIEEGLGGRETIFDDPFDSSRNGLKGLMYVLKSHRPMDVLIISLGTNDTKTMFNATVRVIVKGYETLITTARNYCIECGCPVPTFLVVSPIFVGDDVESSPFASFDRSSVEKSHALAPALEAMAKAQGAAFLDASLFASPSTLDSLHMEAEGHEALARAMADKLLNL